MIQLRSTPSVLVLLLTLAGLAACGGAKDSPSEEVGSSAGPTPRSASSDPGGRTTEHGAPTAPAGDPRYGAPLQDPSRYYGVYASSKTPNRQWFVAEAKRPKYAEQAPEVPPGHLALGAMFGDVAPFHMKTLSTTRFEQAWVSEHQGEPVAVEFELDGAGRAVALSFTDARNSALGRLERQGDLPADWE